MSASSSGEPRRGGGTAAARTLCAAIFGGTRPLPDLCRFRSFNAQHLLQELLLPNLRQLLLISAIFVVVHLRIAALELRVVELESVQSAHQRVFAATTDLGLEGVSTCTHMRPKCAGIFSCLRKVILRNFHCGLRKITGSAKVNSRMSSLICKVILCSEGGLIRAPHAERTKRSVPSSDLNYGSGKWSRFDLTSSCRNLCAV